MVDGASDKGGSEEPMSDEDPVVEEEDDIIQSLPVSLSTFLTS